MSPPRPAQDVQHLLSLAPVPSPNEAPREPLLDSQFSPSWDECSSPESIAALGSVLLARRCALCSGTSSSHPAEGPALTRGLHVGIISHCRALHKQAKGATAAAGSAHLL